jgi:hypothetical protein
MVQYSASVAGGQLGHGFIQRVYALATYSGLVSRVTHALTGLEGAGIVMVARLRGVVKKTPLEHNYLLSTSGNGKRTPKCLCLMSRSIGSPFTHVLPMVGMHAGRIVRLSMLCYAVLC